MVFEDQIQLKQLKLDEQADKIKKPAQLRVGFLFYILYNILGNFNPFLAFNVYLFQPSTLLNALCFKALLIEVSPYLALVAYLFNREPILLLSPLASFSNLSTNPAPP